METPRKIGRKTSKSTMVSARINTVFHDRLKAMADAEGRSLSELVDRAVEEYVKAHHAEVIPTPARKTPR